MKRFLIIPALLLLITGCSSQQAKPDITEFDYFYFDTSINVKIYDDSSNFDPEKINTEIEQLLIDSENEYSPSNADSTINQLNSGKISEVSDNFIDILEKSIEACDLTAGRYDPSSGSLIDLWSINNANHIPTDAEIATAMKQIGCDDISIDGNTVNLPTNYKLDFGSSVKGYAGDWIEQILVDNGVENALINLGGNIQAVGNKYGSPFKIGIMKPEVENEFNENVAYLEIDDTAMVTSGINQRFFVDNGNVYHHIIDATTGYPADNNLASVSIVTEQGANADILSTMTFLMGLDEGYDFINSLDGVEAIFITRDKKIYQTKDFNLELLDDTYTIEQK